SAQGWPTSPSVQRPSQVPVAHELLVQWAFSMHGSPTAPEEHFPPLDKATQASSSWHSSPEVHALPALPSVHVPSLAPEYDFPQNPLLHSLPSAHGEPRAPSAQRPRLSEVAPTQTSL